jgi:CheY-like chemotaxis protein
LLPALLAQRLVSEADKRIVLDYVMLAMDGIEAARKTSSVPATTSMLLLEIGSNWRVFATVSCPSTASLQSSHSACALSRFQKARRHWWTVIRYQN